MAVSPWTTEREAKLRELHALGASFARIACELGCTKNAVIGFAHRANLPTRTKQGTWIEGFHETARAPKISAAKSNSRPVRKAPAGPSRGEAEPPPASPRHFPEVAFVEDADVAETQTAPGISFMQQRDGLCRWPLTGDTSFYEFRACGCSCAYDRPYCGEHAERASAGRPVPQVRTRTPGGMMPRSYIFGGGEQ